LRDPFKRGDAVLTSTFATLEIKASKIRVLVTAGGSGIVGTLAKGVAAFGAKVHEA